MLGNFVPSPEVCKEKPMLRSLRKGGNYLNNLQRGAKEMIAYEHFASIGRKEVNLYALPWQAAKRKSEEESAVYGVVPITREKLCGRIWT